MTCVHLVYQSQLSQGCSLENLPKSFKVVKLVFKLSAFFFYFVLPVRAGEGLIPGQNEFISWQDTEEPIYPITSISLASEDYDATWEFYTPSGDTSDIRKLQTAN